MVMWGAPTIVAEKASKFITVLLVDDQPAFRQLARRLLERGERFRVVGEAPSAEAALREAQALQPDLVLMDVFMSGMSGIEAAKLFRHTLPNITVVLVSAYDNLSELASEAGAAFMSKREFSAAALLSSLNGPASQDRPAAG
ncbi:MAG: response regulator transcription factor [Chloroflexota bacterium]|nr:response regulator transcription factor [Chloroflexota bacterium]